MAVKVFLLHWICVGAWNCWVLALRKDSAKTIVQEFALHFLMQHNDAWCTYDRVLCTDEVNMPKLVKSENIKIE